MVNRTVEKVELAKELGLHSWADMQTLMGMKFLPINLSQISVKLREGRLVWKKEWMSFESIYFMSGLLGTFVFLMSAAVIFTVGSNKGASAPVFPIALSGALFGFFIPWICSGIRTIRIEKMNLNQWTDNLPYGALLAVKEATKFGFTSFEIYYPEARSVRVISDPVITGIKNQTRFEIFSWDDGKTYE